MNGTTMNKTVGKFGIIQLGRTLWGTVCAITVAFSSTVEKLEAADRPNILWLTSEDHGPHMGCYGDRLARTPNIDALASKGMLFKRAWSCAPVCAPARTTIISGLYPPSFGAEHMRSEVPMPGGTQMYPQLLREAGYYCTNNSKEDYNATKPGKVWDESSNRAHWKARQADQPFFAIFNSTSSHESQIRKRPHPAITDPAKVRVPAYHPDTPEVRQDWAQYYDKVSEVDSEAGNRLREVAEAGLSEDTIVFYFADHGSGMPRNKRWPCNSGLQVPMVIYFPEKWISLAPREYRAGSQSDRLISFVDLAPTLLSIVGIRPPEWMQGYAFAGKFQTRPQPFVFGFRGRMDERYDFVRSVTDGRFTYLRNYMPQRSQAQHVGYQFETPTTQVWRRLFDEGKLNDAQSIFWKIPKAAEELYDLQSDPDEVHNLANLPEYRATLVRMRTAQRTLASKIRDTGFLAEAEVHARSGNRSPRDALNSETAYPFEAIASAAETAAGSDMSSLPQLEKYLTNTESGVRYWGAMGALIRGSEAVEKLYPELIRALHDASPSVRVVAAEAIGTYGKPADLTAALDTLAQSADPSKTSAYAATSAMNSIDALGAKALPLMDFVKTMPTKDPQAVNRANEYVGRMKTHVLNSWSILEKGK